MTTPADAKQEGATPTEQYLASLCERSFLGLWSYPNVYRDQGKEGDGDGKELCDVLAVFGDDVVIFSDKHSEFPKGQLEVAWRRWYKRTIADGAKQIAGAERWIRSHPGRLYLDRRCTVRFPIDLPPPERMRVHRVVLALGAGAACADAFGSSTGSLMFCPEMASPLDPRTSTVPSQPFVVGSLAPFVHVFDDATLPVILGELDTVSDFVNYLLRKEEFVRDGSLLLSSGEDHLLAYYLRGGYTFTRAPDGRTITVGEDLWDGWVADGDYQARRDALRASYAWDGILHQLTEDILAERMIAGSEHGTAGHERRVRALASAPREVRAALVSKLLPLLTDPTVATHFRSAVHPMQPDTAYLLLVMRRDGLADEHYRRNRSLLLSGYCLGFARRHRAIHHIVGISTGPSGDGDDDSHEVVYVDGADLRPEDEELALRMELDFNLFTTLDNIHSETSLVEEHARGEGGGRP